MQPAAAAIRSRRTYAAHGLLLISGMAGSNEFELRAPCAINLPSDPPEPRLPEQWPQPPPLPEPPPLEPLIPPSREPVEPPIEPPLIETDKR
jgi:hypothetical protein